MKLSLLCSLTVTAFTLLSSVDASSNPGTSINGNPFPSLLDVTTEDLITGLESGLFTSVDLVNASIPGSPPLPVLTLYLGVRRSHL